MKHIRPYKLFEGTKDIDTEYMTYVKNKDTKSLNNIVKSYAQSKGYNIGPVYHGTDAEFTEFDIEKVAWLLRSDDQMKFYFAFDKKNAEPPGFKKPKRVIIAYLSGTKQGEYGEDDRGEDILIPKDADHVILGDLHVSVRYPEQIKSADPITYDDNNEIIMLSNRFDKRKKDIRY